MSRILSETEATCTQAAILDASQCCEGCSLHLALPLLVQRALAGPRTLPFTAVVGPLSGAYG